jgi:hypothetical protein
MADRSLYITVIEAPNFVYCVIGYLKSLHKPNNEVVLLHVPEFVDSERSRKSRAFAGCCSLQRRQFFLD